MKIKVNDLEVEFELNNSEVAKEIKKNLPIKGSCNRWGEEIYFDIGLDINEDRDFLKQEMEVGELAYWKPGKAFCIFFGKTPVSDSDKPKAYSPVTLIGKVKGDAMVFKKARDGDKILIE